MEIGLFNRKKTHKVKARRHITFMIITDPTKKAHTIKIPKWIRFPILITIVSVALISLNTLGYIEELRSQTVLDRLAIQTKAYTIDDKEQVIGELEMTNEERYKMLTEMEATQEELAAKYEELNETINIFNQMLNSTEKTTDSQPSEEIVVRAAEEIVDLTDELEVDTEIVEDMSVNDENFDAELMGLNYALNDSLEIHDVLEDNLELLQEEAEVILPYWEAYPSGFPCDSTYITCDYGWRTHPVYYNLDFHNGIDLAAIYDDVYATGKGVVTDASYSGSYGYRIVIDHGYGYTTLYAHLSKMYVEVGDEVSRGDVIARSGNTGSSTGAHLHYEIHIDGESQDPENYIY